MQASPVQKPLWRSFAIIFVAAALAYANSIPGAFVFDDVPNIIANPYVTNLSSFFSMKVELDPLSYPYLLQRPLGFLSFALNYALADSYTPAYHLVNLLIHMACAALVMLLTLELLSTPGVAMPQRRGVALLTALVFAVHPVESQAVSYIVQRLTSQAAMFYLLSVLLYVRGVKRGGMLLTALSIASAVAGMLTKEIVFTLPLMVAAVDYIFFAHEPGRLRRLWPYGIVLLVIPAVYLVTLNMDGVGVMEAVDAAARPRDFSRALYLATELRVMLTYIRLMLLPVNQSVEFGVDVFSSAINWSTAAGALGVAACFYVSYVSLKRFRERGGLWGLISLGVLWFFIALAVESTLVPLEPIFEHRLYLSSVGAIMAASAGSAMMFDRLGPAMKRAMAVGAVILCALFLMLTMSRNTVWQSEYSLWADAVVKAPLRARPHNNLGNAMLESGEPGGALMEFNEALRINPSYDHAYFNLGNLYRSRGQLEIAIYYYEKALELNPKNFMVHNNLASGYMYMGKNDMAEAQYRKAIKLYPSNTEAMNNLSTLLSRQGRQEESLELLRRAEDINPRLPIVQYNMGRAYYMLGNKEAARKAYLRALALDPSMQAAAKELQMMNSTNSPAPQQ